MKIVYYIIHNTHTFNHVKLSLSSFKNQSIDLKWEKLVIKNSIPQQINNSDVWTFLKEIHIMSVFGAIEFVEPSEINTTYNDLRMAIEYGKNAGARFLLFTKAEYCYSVDSFGVFANLFNRPNKNWVFTPPIVNATELATREEIMTCLEKKQVPIINESTGYDGDDHHRLNKKPLLKKIINKVLVKLKLRKPLILVNNDLGNRKIDESKTYKFITHNVVLDINVHLFTNTTLQRTDFNNDELNLQWGRIRTLDRLLESGTAFIINHDCFSVHQFHEIPSARLGRNIKGVRY